MTSPMTTKAPSGIDELATLPIAPVRRPWQRATTVVVLVLLLVSVAVNPNMGWPVVGRYLFSAEVLHGIGWTVLLTVLCMMLATVLGIVIAVMRTANNRAVRGGLPLPVVLSAAPLSWCS
jgi:polar amino acid transport system permease protein